MSDSSNNPFGGLWAQSPANLITPAVNPILTNLLARGDARPAFQINGDGSMEWGAGGSSALDAALWRDSTGYHLHVGTPSGVYVKIGGFSGGTGPLVYGSTTLSIGEINNGGYIQFTSGFIQLQQTLKNAVAANEVATATAGAAALPANPVGFLAFQDHNGTTRKIPYYAN